MLQKCDFPKNINKMKPTYSKYFEKVKSSKLKVWFKTAITLILLKTAFALGIFAYYEQLQQFAAGQSWSTEVSWLLFNLIAAGLSFVELNTESRFATAFYRSGKFILCELCVCLSMMKFWFVSPFSRERGDIWTVSYAFLWLTCGVSYTLMNSFNHLLLIKHTIGGTHKRQLNSMSLLRSIHIAICLILMLGEIIVQIGSVNILEVIVLHIILFNIADLGIKSSMSGKEYEIKNGFKSSVTKLFVSNRKCIAWIILVPFIKMVINMIILLSTTTEALPDHKINIYPQNEKFPIFAAYIMYNLCFSAARDFALKGIIEAECEKESILTDNVAKDRAVQFLLNEKNAAAAPAVNNEHDDNTYSVNNLSTNIQII